MADFCKQCSLELFGEDNGDLKGLGDGRKLEPGFGWTAICEGCGFTIVDDDGACINKYCDKKHGEKHENAQD